MVSKTLKTVPAWLDVSEDRKSAIEVPERTAVVRRIFEDAASGLGAYAIARRLTEGRVPTFGRSQKWQPSSIDNMLSNRAVLGEFQSSTYVGKKPTPSGPPIADFYPRIIDDHLFEEVQARRRSDAPHRKGRKGSGFANIFGTRLHCANCKGRSRILNAGGVRTVVCANAYLKLGRAAEQFSLADLETALLTEIMRQGDPALTQLKYDIAQFALDPYRWRSQFVVDLENIISRIDFGCVKPGKKQDFGAGSHKGFLRILLADRDIVRLF